MAANNNLKSKGELRREKIRTMLIAKDFITLGEFCKTLNASEATIRNDLRYLENKGLIKRTYGGALATGNTAFNSNISMRLQAHLPEKESIATYIVNNILKSGQVIILDTGTTSAMIAKKIIASDLNLTVLTNSFEAATILSSSDKINLYLAGGHYDPLTAAFNDEIAQHFFENMYADIFFLSVNGISLNAGLSVSGSYNTIMKKLMLKAASKCIVTADSSKLDKTGLKIICDFDQVTSIITDNKASNTIIKKYQQQDIEIIVAND